MQNMLFFLAVIIETDCLQQVLLPNKVSSDKGRGKSHLIHKSYILCPIYELFMVTNTEQYIHLFG